MRVSCCCCACCLFAVSCCGALRVSLGCVGGLVCVVVGFAFLGRTDVRTDARVGRMSERMRSCWTTTGLSFGPSTRVFGACLCACPQEPAGWPGCGYVRRWVSLDPCFSLARGAWVCACVCGWACLVVRAGCLLRFWVARVCGVYVAPGIPLGLKWARGPVRVCAWAVGCPSPPVCDRGLAAASGCTTSSTRPRRKRRGRGEGVVCA